MEKEIINQLKMLRAEIMTLTRVMIDVKYALEEPVPELYADKLEQYSSDAYNKVGVSISV